MAATRIQAKEHRNIVNKIIWIASDAWCCRESVTHGLEGVIEGAISITPQHYHLEGFSDYFQSLRPENNPDNPWFKEYWRHHSNCSLVGGQSVCSIDKDLPQSPTLHFIRDAFYSYSFTFQVRSFCVFVLITHNLLAVHTREILPQETGNMSRDGENTDGRAQVGTPT